MEDKNKKIIITKRDKNDIYMAMLFLFITLILLLAYFFVNNFLIKQIVLFISIISMALFCYGLTLWSINPTIEKSIRAGFALVSLSSVISLLLFYFSGIFNDKLIIYSLRGVAGIFLATTTIGWIIETHRLKHEKTGSIIAPILPIFVLLIGSIIILQDIFVYQVVIAIIIIFSLDLAIEFSQLSNIESQDVSIYNIEIIKKIFKTNIVIRIIILIVFFVIFNKNLSYFISDNKFIFNYLSIMIQVLATIVSLLIAFIAIIIPFFKFESNNSKIFAKGIKGFSLYFLVILILCIMLLAIKIDVNSINITKSHKILDYLSSWENIQYILGITIFEAIFLSIPLGLTYLYALVRDFLAHDLINDSIKY